ncbi:MAG: efflux transporter outer membrane subunit [Planctomycetota bacterium]
MIRRSLYFTAILAGCAAVGPDYEPPQIETPDSFRDGSEESVLASELSSWWSAFGDATLTELVEDVLARNLDVQVAVERIEEVRARFGVARADRLPTLDVTGSYSRTRPILFPEPRTQNQWTAGGEFVWELDLFGRVRRSVEAAGASLEAQVEDLRAVQVLLAAETAATYLRILSISERLEIARRNVDAQRQSQLLATERFRAGIVAGLDPAQADVNLFSSRATVPALELALRRDTHRLAVLAGRPPRALDSRLASVGDLPDVPGELLVGVPADLLRNRPDVRAAERRLAAQTARVGVATAALYPAVNLSGTWDWLARTSNDVLGDGIETGAIGPLVSIPIFNGRRLRSNVEIEEAIVRQLAIALRQSLLIAQEEVENSLVAIVEDRRRAELLTDASSAAERSVGLSRELYTSGQASFQRVLDAQRSLFTLEDQVAQSRLDVLLDVVDLYRSLGGGWTAPEGTEPEEEP